ncbi:hypothetical protein AVEN_42461-1, partial [Araneus ventricosus]
NIILGFFFVFPNTPTKQCGPNQYNWLTDYKSSALLNSDVSFTPERIRGSGSSKGTTGSDSDRKERIR